MKKSEIKTLLSFVEAGKLSCSSIGLFVYFFAHQGDILTYEVIEKETRISINTIRKHVYQMENLNIIERVQSRRGISLVIRPTNFWDSSVLSYSYISYINNNKNQENIYDKEIEEILEDLESKAGKTFSRKNSAVKQTMIARFKEGYTVEDFLTVNRNMTYWLDESKMVRYYRPSTLYQKTKFPVYLEDTSGVPKYKKTTSKFRTKESIRIEAEQREKQEREFGNVEV